jgi:RNA polymerase sigma-70 factor (ECF subfamily)
VRLYDLLLTAVPSPVVALNRAVALAMSEGPTRGLDVVNEIGATGELDGYYLFHSTRADLLRRLGRNGESGDAYSRAIELATNDVERSYLERRRQEVLSAP